MVVTPPLFAINAAIERRARRRDAASAYDELPSDDSQVIIAGFGRFGQVDFVRNYGAQVYYGDASRLDLLMAAGADRAVAFVLAIDDVEASVRTAETVCQHFPDLRIYARVRNRSHAYRLMELGIAVVWRETLHSSLAMAGELLKGLGLSDYAADRAVDLFRNHDERRLYSLFGEHPNEARMQMLAKRATQELEELFAQDAAGDRGPGP
jgi:glutathione-regulated potassium-efflux system protein KefB